MTKAKQPEESNLDENGNFKWDAHQFNFAASPDEVSLIQQRVTKRINCDELMEGIRKDIEKADLPEEAKEGAVGMTLYIHTAYEMGREAGMADAEKFIQGFLEKKMKETK